MHFSVGISRFYQLFTCNKANFVHMDDIQNFHVPFLSSNMTKAHGARRTSISSMSKKDHFYSLSSIYIFKLWINVSGNVLFKGGRKFYQYQTCKYIRIQRQGKPKIKWRPWKKFSDHFSLTSGNTFSKLIQKSRNK